MMTPQMEQFKAQMEAEGMTEDVQMSRREQAEHHEKLFLSAVAQITRSQKPSDCKDLVMIAITHFTQALRNGRAHGEILRIASDFIWDERKAFAKMLGVKLDGAPSSNDHCANAINAFIHRLHEGDDVKTAEIQAYDAYWKNNPKGIGVVLANGKWTVQKGGVARCYAADISIFNGNGGAAGGGSSLAEVGMKEVRKVLRKYDCYSVQ